MTTIVTKKNSQDYAIYVDGRKIVECGTPETTYNELVKNIGVDTTNVQIIEMESFPTNIGTPQGTIVQDIVQEVIRENAPTDVEDIINSVNATITAPNLSKHKERVATTATASVSENTETAQTSVSNEPIGNVEVPKLGDLVYVDGMDGILRKITGGVGTVHLVYNANDKVEVGTEMVANPEHDEDEEDDNEPEFINQSIVGSNILIELEEIPGVYFSWAGIKDNQTQLKAKYGYKPAYVIK